MPRGMPDWSVSTRLREGVLKEWTDDRMVYTSTVENTVVTGKGIIKGGFLYTDEADLQYGLSIDGQPYVAQTASGAWWCGIRAPWASPIYLINYNKGESRFTFGISSGIIFEKSVKLRYVPAGLTRVIVQVDYGLLI